MGLISRGPFHPDHMTRLVGGRLWTLNELLRDLPPMSGLSRREAQHTAEGADIEGRNCAAFETLRRAAYRLHNQGQTGAALLRQVQHEGEELNRTLAGHAAGPLGARELAGIVKSVCKWVDTHHRPSYRGSPREVIHSRDRGGALSEAEQRARQRAGQAKGARTRREGTTSRLRAAEVQLQAAGRLITAATLAELAGVSNKTALAYLRNACQTAEMK